MSGIFIPLALAFAGFAAAIAAYRDIRRGAARFYTLEREAVLRRAGFILIGSALLFSASIGLLIYGGGGGETAVSDPIAADSDGTVQPTITPTPELSQFPPLETPIPPTPIGPTAVPTKPVCRAQVAETFGNGLTMRDAPGGEQIIILAEGDLVTMLDDEPQPVNDLVWRKVRSLFGDEGWVAESFLEMGAGCE